MAKVIKKTGSDLLPSENDSEKMSEAMKIVRDIEKKTEEIKKLKEKLSPIEEYFDDKLDKGASITTKVGKVTKEIKNSYEFKPERYSLIQKIFGKKIANFITKKETYGTTAEFKKLLKDTEYENWKEISESVVITETTSIKFTKAK